MLRPLGIGQLTPMQEATLEAFRREGDLLLLSPTGSGKTLAFLLPLIQGLNAEVHGVQAVVLVPSRELALQIATVFKQMGTPFRAMGCYGGRPAMEEHRAMKALSPSVVIGTPGRMNDHLWKGNFDAGSVRTLVIDEFDKCLELGFQEEMAEVLGRLPALDKRVLLSATDAEDIPRFVGMGRRVTKLDFLSGVLSDGRLDVKQVLSPQKDKLETLYRLLCVLGASSTLVFVNYRESVDRVVGFLKSKKVACEAFHGGMEQMERERALYKFRNGSCPVLVWFLQIWLPVDWTSPGLAVSYITTCPSPARPLSTAMGVRRVGKRGVPRFLSFIRKSVFLNISREISPCLNGPT